MRVFELSHESDPWPSGPEAADTVHLKVINVSPDMYCAPPDPTALIGAGTAGLWTSNPPTLRTIKEALEVSCGYRFHDEAFLGVAREAAERGIVAAVNASAITLDTRVHRPSHGPLIAEGTISPRELQDLASDVQELKRLAPETDFTFRITIATEGTGPPEDVIAALNEHLARASSTLRLE